MPQYYTGADPTQAFSNGLMAGYEFIDRIKARAEQVRLQKLQEARDSQRFEMQKEGFATQQEAAKFDLSQARTLAEEHTVDRKHAKEREPTLEKQADAEAAARLRAEKLRGDVSQYALDTAKEDRKTQDEGAAAIESSMDRNRTLGTIGAQGVPGTAPWEQTYDPAPAASQQPGAPAAGPAASRGQAQSAPAAEPSMFEPVYDVGKPKPAVSQPQGPVDLAEAQAAADKEPSLVAKFGKAVATKAGQVVNAVGEPGANAVVAVAEGARQNARDYDKFFWGAVAKPKEMGGDVMFGTADEHTRGVPLRQIRGNILAYDQAYLKARPNVAPDDRKVLDYSLQNALNKDKSRITDQLATLPNDKRFDPKRNALNEELKTNTQKLDALRKAQAATAADDVGITEPSVAVNDPRVQQLVQNAAANEAANGPQILTRQQNNVLNRQAERIGASGRLTRSELHAMSRLVAAGKMNVETLGNMWKYGTPIAPDKPTYVNMASGVVLEVYPDGRKSFIVSPVAGKKTLEEVKAHAESIAKGYDYLVKDFNGFVNQGLIPDAKKGSGSVWAAKAVETLRSYASSFEKDTGIRVRDADGNLDLSFTNDPSQRQILTSWLTNTWNGGRKGETAVSMPHEARLEQNIPEARPVLQYGLVRNGMMYVGDGVLDANGRSRREDWIPVK